MKRRQFVKSLSAITGAMLVSPSHCQTNADFMKKLKGIKADKKLWEIVRNQFVLPTDFAYLNTGGLGSSPLMVINKVKEKMAEEEKYPASGHSLPDWWRIKQKCAALLGRGIQKEDVALTGCATEGINVIINGLPFKVGDEIITSSHEHVALNVPLLNAQQTRGIRIKTFSPDLKSGDNNIKLIKQLITARTRLIFISHITCTSGQIFPVKEIGRLAKTRGIWFALDGAQAIGQIPLNLEETGADFYCLSGHKWLLGPKRTGMLYCHKTQVKTLQPSIVGAYSESANDMLNRSLSLHQDARKFEYGTQNDALYYGLETAVEFVNILGLPIIWKHNQSLAEEFYHRLKTIAAVEILSPQEKKYRSSIITFRLKDQDNNQVCKHLLNNHLRVRPVQEAGLNAIRVSFHLYNNTKELEKLIKEITAASD